MFKFLHLAVLSALATSLQPALAGTVQVTGEAEIRVAPDEALITTGIEVRAVSLDEATKLLEDRRGKLLQFLSESGIESKDVHTEHVMVEPIYRERYQPDDPLEKLQASIVDPVAFTIVQLVRVRVRKVDHFDKLLIGVLKHGANRLEGVEFRTTELRKHRDEARRLAVRAAKEKAQLLTEELDVKLGAVVVINEQYAGGWWSWSRGQTQNVMQNVAGGAPPANSESTAGQISVSATVQVTFALPGEANGSEQLAP